jgi:HD-GYP domain-containing protein (c-di-GMP phosphodiesterase class II)
MAVADIFEALTASDRPYKTGKKLSECLKIMGSMKQDKHIDPDIFDIFIKQRIYLDYADEFLDPEQIDSIEEANIPGYCVA